MCLLYLGSVICSDDVLQEHVENMFFSAEVQVYIVIVAQCLNFDLL